MTAAQAQVVCLVGATATGKTQFALDIAEVALAKAAWPFVSIISADSRQVYSGLEVVSGADIPAGWSRQAVSEFEWPVWQNPARKVLLHGLGVLRPDEEWSLGLFVSWAHRVMAATWKKHGLVIVVGGTGLFVDRLFDPAATSLVPPNPELRQQLGTLSLEQLQQQLQVQSFSTWEALTQSDRHNPRRLVRALEKTHDSLTSREQVVAAPLRQTMHSLPSTDQQVWLGLELPIAEIERRIDQRVAARLAAGAVAEVSKLLDHYPSELPALTAAGVKQLAAYLAGQVTLEQAQQAWALAERQYAKRQITWWRQAALRHPQLQWFAADDPSLKAAVEDVILGS